MSPSQLQRATRRAFSRRRALGVTAAAAGGAFLAACGGSSSNNSSGKSTNAAAPSVAAATSASGAATPAAASGTRPPQAPAGASTNASATTAAEQPVKGGTLRRAVSISVLGIDPHIEVSVGIYTIDPWVYSFLGAFNAIEQKLYPIFAESLQQPSQTEFIFKLRQGVKFQNIAPVNGREQTADDVLYSLERFRDLPQAQNNDFFKTVTDKMEVVDKYTFRLTTKAPFAESLSELGGRQKAIVPREAVEKFGDLSTMAIGAGPFLLDQYVKGERTVMKRNPDYWDKNLPYVDGANWVTIMDAGTMLAAYKSDQIDVGAGPYEGVPLTKLDYEELLKNPKLVNLKQPSLSYGTLELNASVKPYDDKRVRQAIWLGMDRQQFIDKISLGEGVPQGVLSNGLNFWALSQDEIKPYITADYQKAKQLLAAAGFPNGFDMDLDTSGGVQAYVDYLDVAVSELKKIGINIKPRLTDLPTYLSDKLFKGNFNATIFTHNPYETTKVPLGFYHKNGIGNGSWFHYANEDISKALDVENGEMELNKRQQLVKDVQKQIMEDAAPLIPFQTPTQFQSYHKRVGGFDPTVRNFQYFRYTDYIRPGA
jgi:peptide/nickel transport system substrate-binding protein